MKRRWTGLVALAALAGCFSEAYAEYDYLRNIQDPGKRRQDVSLDKIEQEGGQRVPNGHRRRVVHRYLSDLPYVFSDVPKYHRG